MAKARIKPTPPGYDHPDGRPLTHDELLGRDNAPPTDSMPAEVALRLATRRVILSGLVEPITPEKLEADGSGYSWRVPGGALVGLPGRTATRLPVPAANKPAPRNRGVVSPPYRPDWAAQVYHPKRTIP